MCVLQERGALGHMRRRRAFWRWATFWRRHRWRVLVLVGLVLAAAGAALYCGILALISAVTVQEGDWEQWPPVVRPRVVIINHTQLLVRRFVLEYDGGKCVIENVRPGATGECEAVVSGHQEIILTITYGDGRTERHEKSWRLPVRPGVVQIPIHGRGVVSFEWTPS